MGFFGEELDLASAPDVGGYADPDAGIYSFEVTGSELKQGVKDGNPWKFFQIDYLLNNKTVEDKKWNESLSLPAAEDFDPSAPNDREKQQLGFLKARLLALGIEPRRLNEFEPDEIEGVTGTFQIVKTPGKGKNAGKEFTNIRSMKVAEKAAKPVQAVARKAPAKRTAAAVQKPAPVAEAVEETPDYETEDVPDEAVAETPAAPARTTPRKPATVTGNPFA